MKLSFMCHKAAITSIGDSLPVAACGWTQTPRATSRDGGLRDWCQIASNPRRGSWVPANKHLSSLQQVLHMKITCKSLHVGTDWKERWLFCCLTIVPSLSLAVPLIQFLAKERELHRNSAGKYWEKPMTYSDSLSTLMKGLNSTSSPIVDGTVVFLSLCCCCTHAIFLRSTSFFGSTVSANSRFFWVYCDKRKTSI